MNTLTAGARAHARCPTLRCARSGKAQVAATGPSRARSARPGQLCLCRADSESHSSRTQTASGSSGDESNLLWSSAAAPLFLLAAEAGATEGAVESTYSQNSYYATLFLFVLSFPGLYSLVKRSAKSKIERKTFEVPGPAVPGAMSLDDRARALFAYFKRNNYAVTSQGEVIAFEGTVKPERGTAAYITFCAFLGLGSAALVTSIAVPWIGESAYWMTGLSPAAGAYYWANAERKETMRVKIVTADDDQTTDIIIEGDANEIERCSKELALVEKGKVYVKGLLETA